MGHTLAEQCRFNPIPKLYRLQEQQRIDLYLTSRQFSHTRIASKYNKVISVTIGNDDGENVPKNSLTTRVLMPMMSTKLLVNTYVKFATRKKVYSTDVFPKLKCSDLLSTAMACLNVECHAGKAKIHLQLNLQHPLHHPVHQQPHRVPKVQKFPDSRFIHTKTFQI